MRKARAFAATLLIALPGFGASISFGILSFDVQIASAGGQLGVNRVGIENLTGLSSLPPDFPITDAITLSNLQLTINSAGGAQTVSLGTLGPGTLTANPALQFASNLQISSITLSATLSPTSFHLAGASSAANVSNTAFLYVLSPSAGQALQAGVDLGVLQLVADTGVPEPSTWTGVATGLAAAAGAGLRRKGFRR